MAMLDLFGPAFSDHDTSIDSDASATLNFVARSPVKTEKLEDQSFGRFRAEADKMQQRIPLS